MPTLRPGYTIVPGDWVYLERIINELGYYEMNQIDLLKVPYTGASGSVTLGSYNLTANRLTSTVASGTSPFVVTSNTVVSNLNADLLDGHDSLYFATSAGYVPYTGATANLNLGTFDFITKGDYYTYDGAGTDYLVSSHDGTDGILGTNVGAINLMPKTDINLHLGDAGGTNKIYIKDSGTAVVASIDSNGAAVMYSLDLTTALAVADGGTGRVTSTTPYGLLAAGTTDVAAHQTLAAGATTQILVGGGASALPAWGTDIPTAVTIGSAYIYRAGGTNVAVADGGTNLDSCTAGSLLHAASANTWEALAVGASAGMFLRSTGTLAAWSTLILPNAATATRLVYASSANTYGEHANLTFTSGTTLNIGTMSITANTITGGSSIAIGVNGTDTDFYVYGDTVGDYIHWNAETSTLSLLGSDLLVGNLTATRIPYASTGGLLVDSANLTFSGSELNVIGNIDVSAYYYINNTLFLANAGTNNVQLGTLAMAYDGASVNECVAIGLEAGRYLTGAAQNNVFIGAYAGTGKTTSTWLTGSDNLGIGTYALYALSTGGYNVAVGSSAGGNIEGGSKNFAFGYQALLTGVSASDNVAIGYYALNKATDNQNVAIGSESQRYEAAGSLNVSIGYRAGRGTDGQTHYANIFIGADAGYTLNGASNYNQGIGYQSCYSLTTGDNNNCLGFSTGYSLTSGVGNIFLGHYAGYRQTTESNLLLIDNAQRADKATEVSNSILYGVMAAAPADQDLRVNADLYLIDTSTYFKNNSGDIDIYTAANKTIELQTSVYKDINLGAANFWKPSAGYPNMDEFKDAAGNDTGIETHSFTLNQSISGQFEVQHDYKEGTDLTFHVHWQGITAPAGGTDNVQWRLKYVISRDGQVMNAPTTIDSPDKAITAQYQCARSDFGAIAGATGGDDGGVIKIGDQFLFLLTRTAVDADEYAGDALLITAGVHYQIDTIGSRTISAK